MPQRSYQSLAGSETENEKHRPPPAASGLRLGALNWWTLCQLVLLFILPVLMISNIDFSTPPPFQLRFGGSLNIPAWLVFVGFEFSTLFSNVVQGLGSSLTSTFLTKRLMSDDGLKLSTLLNSLESAPVRAQFQGLKYLSLCRTILLILGASLALVDKFSFASIRVNGTILFNITDSIVITPAGYAPKNSSVNLPTNLLDVIGSGDETSIRFRNQTFIRGPGINVSIPDSLLHGRVQDCYPEAYNRFSIQSLSPSTEQADTDSGPFTISQPNTSVTMDIRVTENGTLTAGLNSTGTGYSELVTVTSEECVGYVSWTKDHQLNDVQFSPSQYYLQDPEHPSCVPAQFNLSWFQSGLFKDVTISLLQLSFVEGSDSNLDGLQGIMDANTTLFEYLVLHILATITPPDSTSPDAPSFFPVHPSCKGKVDPACAADYYACAGQLILATGLVEGTGITAVGVALQAFIALFAFVSLINMAAGTPPLITTWPAQWLSLLIEYDPLVICRTVRGTSAGNNEAQGRELVFLSSSGERYPRLELSGSRNGRTVDMEKKHL